LVSVVVAAAGSLVVGAGVPDELDATTASPTSVPATPVPWSGPQAVVAATRAMAPLTTRARRRPPEVHRLGGDGSGEVAICIVTPCLERDVPCDGALH
jgi:hypothetical protein